MSDLTASEKRKLERLFSMGGGYVLEFSNNSLDQFFKESIGRSLYDPKYAFGSGSKANQMRGFWKEEANPIVAKLVGDLLDYMESDLEIPDRSLLAECRKIVERLKAPQSVAGIDAIATIGAERDLEVVATAVLDCIQRGQLVTGLDRLHTFATGFLRTLCEERNLNIDRGKPLHALFGEYVRSLRDAGQIESKMTAAILKSLNGPLDAFNELRNNQSLAHDNQLLNHDEAALVFDHVTSSLRFLRQLDRRVRQRQEQSPSSSDDVLF